MQSRDEIYNKLAQMIHESYEIPLDEIKPESRFYEDLGLDSIDAIDLIGQIQAIVGERIKPEHFKEVLTVEDVVTATERLLAE